MAESTMPTNWRVLGQRGSAWIAVDPAGLERCVFKPAHRFVDPGAAVWLERVRHRALPVCHGRCSVPLPLEGSQNGRQPVDCFRFEYLRGDNAAECFGMSAHRGRRDARSEQIVPIAEQILSALTLLHQGGELCLIHRDIKPANIIVTQNGDAALIDFDAAIRLTRISDHSARTTAFAAPEVLRGGPAGTAADLHALALTILCLASGCRPEFGRSRPPQQILPPALQPLAGWLGRGLEPDPDWRYADAAEMRCDLILLAQRCGLPGK